MTAEAVIEQIKALAPEERAKVVGFIRDLDGELARTADDKVFREAADWTFREHADLMRKLSE